MPINKNAYIRYLAYDNCLRNPGRKHTWKDLRDAANRSLETQSADPIGKTQFFKDIKALKGPPFYAPIVSEKSFYRYADHQYSITNQPLNELEAEQIKSALMVLSRFKGLPQFEWVHEIIPKIEKQFGLDSQITEVIGFDQNIDLKGLEHFETLFSAIINKQVLSIDYKAFRQDGPMKMVIHPYYLKQYNNRWYLFGFNPGYNSLSNPALDRITAITSLVSHKFVENVQFDFNEYFEDMIGITKSQDAESQIIKLWFSPVQAPYINTKPLHGTQKVKSWDETGMIMTIEVVPNFELEQLILQFGENCKVMEPMDFQQKIKARTKKNYENYL